MSELTAFTAAEADRQLRWAENEIDTLIRAFNIGKAEVGREKNILDLGSMLLHGRSKVDLASIAMVAIARLAETT